MNNNGGNIKNINKNINKNILKYFKILRNLRL